MRVKQSAEKGISQSSMLSLKRDLPFLCEFSIILSMVKLNLA